MLKEAILRAALGAAALSFAGAAMAAQPDQLAQSSPSQPGMESGGGAGSPPAAGPSESPSTTGSGSESPSGTSGSASGGASIQAEEGMDVVNAQGDKIGEVSAIEGDDVIVSVGGFLGMGAREVALPKDQLQMSGSGEQAKLQTSMTQEELEKLPAHEAQSGTSGSSTESLPGGQRPERDGGSPPASGSDGASGGGSSTSP